MENKLNNRLNIRIDSVTKTKAILGLKAKGKNLSQEVRKLVEEYAKEYEKSK